MDILSEFFVDQIFDGIVKQIKASDMTDIALEHLPTIFEAIEKAPDNYSLTITKINGNLTLLISDKKDVVFESQPNMINVSDLLQRLKDEIDT